MTLVAAQAGPGTLDVPDTPNRTTYWGPLNGLKPDRRTFVNVTGDCGLSVWRGRLHPWWSQVSMVIGTDAWIAIGVQMSVSTSGVSIDTTREYRAPVSLRSRFGCSFHQPLTG